MKATVYYPGQPPRVLTPKETRQLVWGVAADGLLTCDGQTTETLLGVAYSVGTDVLHVTARVAVWGVCNAADYNYPPNPLASLAARRLHPALAALVGPILIVEAEGEKNGGSDEGK